MEFGLELSLTASAVLRYDWDFQVYYYYVYDYVVWLRGVGVCVVCDKQADIALILDESTSIVEPRRGGYDNWQVSVKGFIYSLIEAFPIGPTQTRVGIVSFSRRAWLSFGFDAYNDSRTLIDAVRDMNIQGGETNIAEVN